MLRKLIRGAALALGLLAAAPAWAIPPGELPPILSGNPQAAAPAPAPLASTFLGYAQISPATGVSNTITLPATATVPNTAPGAWLWVQKFRYDDQAANTPSGAQAVTLAAACGVTGCSGGSDRALQVSNPLSSATLTKQGEISLTAKRTGSSNLWVTPCGGTCNSTGVNLTPGKSYCVVAAQYAGGQFSISANDNTGVAATGSPAVQTTANNTSSPGAANYYYAAGSGSPAAQTNLFNTIGASTATTSAFQNGTGGPFGEAAMIYGSLLNVSGTPDATALAKLCDGSMDLGAWITAYVTSPSLKSYYPLNNPNASPPTTFASGTLTGFSPSVSTAATVSGGDTTQVIPASPVDPLQCLTLNEKGPYDVAPLDAGQSGSGVGRIQVSGTVSAAACGFKPRGVDARVFSINTGAAITGWRALTLVGSTYSGLVTSVPGSTSGNGCYRVSVRLKNSRNYVLAGQYPVCVGFSYLRVGQSQVVYMTAPNTTGTGTGAKLAGNGTVTMQFMALNDSGNVAANHGGGQVSMVRLDANNNPGSDSANQLTGDGIVEEAQDLAADLGVPVKVISIAKSGQSSDAWSQDYQPQSATLTGSGTGAYSVATMFSSAVPTNAGASATFLGTTFNNPGNTQMTVLKGSVKILDNNGATVATESGGGTFTGANVSAGGTLNYLTGAIGSLTFTGSQVSPLRATWTAIQDTNGGTNTQQSPYIGYAVWGDGATRTSGYVTQVLREVFQPVSAILFEQCTSDGTAIGAKNPPPTNAAGYPLSWATKWNYVLTSRLQSSFPLAVRASTPVMVLGYGRDNAAPRGNNAGCRQALTALANSGAPYSYGGSYIDTLLQCSGGIVLCLGPHEGPWILGARRMARRAAAFLLAKQTGNTVVAAEPTITNASRSSTTVTFTVTLPNGGALTTCGDALSAAADTPSQTVNTCSPPGSPVGVTAEGFNFGFSPSTMYDSAGYDTGNIAVDDTKTFACTIASATTVTCSASWFATGLYWAYGGDKPFGSAGTVKLPAVTGGSGYTGSGATVTGTGATNASGGICVHATMVISQVAGVVKAVRATTGSACVGTDTFALTGLASGSGGAVSGVYYAPHDDVNRVGQLLYDNTGNCNGTRSAVTYEPGCAVTPIAVPQGPLA